MKWESSSEMNLDDDTQMSNRHILKYSSYVTNYLI